MRRSLIIAAVAAAAAAAAFTVINASDGGGKNSTGAPASQQATANINGELPAWSTDAAGTYSGQIKMPADAKVIETLTGANSDIGTPTTYKPAKSGNGMQVRYVCNKKLLSDGVYYFSPKIGTLDAAGNYQSYEDAPSDQVSGSWFFNWDWLSNNIGQPNSKGFISVWGNCKWEIRLLSFPAQPLPGS